tara:strand:- start:15310 stop:16053 length:744 start_codon:yes stop_codon:yes gene_type:complete
MMKLFLVLLTLLSLAVGHAKNNEAKIAMGLTKPPYIFTDTESGLECEIIREAFKAVGIDFKPTFAPLNRGEIMLKSGDVDGATNKLEKTLDGYPSDPYIDYHNVAASLKDRHLKIEKPSDLANYSVAAFQTAQKILGPDFESMANTNSNYVEVAEQKLQVMQLLKKRVDVIIGDILIIQHYQRQFKEDSGIKEEISIHDLFKTTSYVIMFKNAKLRDSFNLGLAKIRKSKKYAELLNKYSISAQKKP